MIDHRPKTADAIRRYQPHPDAIVEAGEVLGMRFSQGDRLTLRAAKLFHLLLDAAGPEVTKEKQHRITFASLNETFRRSVIELEALVDELHGTVLKLRLTDEKGRPFTKSGTILSDVEREDEGLAQAELRFEFSPTMRKIIADSTHWAVLSRRAVLAFGSRYTLNLYAAVSLRANLRKAVEAFDLESFRDLLGVRPGVASDWRDLRRQVIEPAIAEINQIADVHAEYQPIRKGRKVVGVSLSWGRKDQPARAEAMKELDRPKVGRKARREDAAEQIVQAETREREALSKKLLRVGCDDRST